MPEHSAITSRFGAALKRLDHLLEVFQTDDRVLVIINADPDAISSAMALKRLLWRKVFSVALARTNVIKRPDNLALIELVKLNIVHISDVKTGDYNKIVVVDSQPHHFENLAKLHFHVVIDHHPAHAYDAAFLDIRPDYGATATMLTEYLRAAKIKPNRNLATALFYGIKTDTSNFARQGQIEDMRAFRFLFPLINQNILRKVETSELTRASLKHFQRALDLVRIWKDRAFVHMGRVDNPDTLVMIADFFMRVHDINRSIVSGTFGDKVVVIFRQVGYRANAGQLAEEMLGQYGSAGGHKAMARAEIPLANLDAKIQHDDAALARFIHKRVTTTAKAKQVKS